MFDRLKKPFLTVETGEAYQPIRLSYSLSDPNQFAVVLEGLSCIKKNVAPNSWSWYWEGECENLHFESVSSFRKNADNPVRLATLTIRNNRLYINLTSFKRACFAVTFFHKVISRDTATIKYADFINKVFSIDERLPHGFAELFKDDELDQILNQRLDEYHKVKESCEMASSAEEAFSILAEYTNAEAKKKLPYAERYTFDLTSQEENNDVVFLAFYIFLRGRELVAIKRWMGQSSYSLFDAVDETVGQVFGEMGIDILE